MRTDVVSYFSKNVSCSGLVVYEESPHKKPCILLAPTFQGLGPFAKEKAQTLASWGYVVFVVDLYGEGKSATDDTEASSCMMPLFLDREMLQERMQAAYACAKSLKQGDPHRMGAIGFCFGGTAVLELLRAGNPLSAAVCVHGVLGTTLGGKTAQPASKKGPLQGNLLVLHGNLDPLVPMQDLIELQKEMSQEKVAWQSHIFGTAGHSFTNPNATDKTAGLYFDKTANQVSFLLIQNFFKDIFA